MSTQKFSAIERRAIFDAYTGRCLYTGDYLDISDFHIDHIIPESIKEKPTEFSELKKKLGLGDDFNINGYENLCATAPRINRLKSNHTGNPNNTRFYLDVALRNKNKIIDLISKIEKKISVGNLNNFICQAVEKSKVDIPEIINLISQSNIKIKEFNVGNLVSFYVGDSLDTISNEQLSVILKREMPHSIRLTKLDESSPESVVISTPLEFEKYTKLDFHPDSMYDCGFAIHYRCLVSLIRLLEKAKPFKNSHMKNVGVCDINLIPSTLAPQIQERSSVLIDNSATYGTWVDVGHIVIKNVTSSSLHVSAFSSGQIITEITRASFDGKGREQILAFISEHALEGTHRYGYCAIFDRASDSSVFKVTPYDIK